MAESIRIIELLTSGELSYYEKVRLVKDFSQELGWEPGEAFDPDPELEGIVSSHLLVEHGLENSAVITFIISPNRHKDFSPQQRNKSLELSYNNLVDWHIYVENDKVTYVFNRTYPAQEFSYEINSSDVERIKSTMFDQITGKAPNPNFPALDSELVNNISFWKRNLAAELDGKPELTDYAALFNSLMFVRAAEDHRRRKKGSPSKILVDRLKKIGTKKIKAREIIRDALQEFISGKLPKYVYDSSRLKSFDSLPPSILYDLFSSFYKSRNVPYGYDFAIMSKHALTRIYEKYVALLSFQEDIKQLSFLPIMPSESYNKSFGSVYTPEFIARFFARFAQNHLPLKEFRSTKVIDPACGSGIFLRTMLEFQCAPNFDPVSSEDIRTSFDNVVGIDVDENATQASRLSLALLHLVLMSGELPSKLNIHSKSAFDHFKSLNISNEYGLFVSNPPYISSDVQSAETRKKIQDILGDLGKGKTDSYLPFLKFAVDALQPGGFGMFVLPHSFLKLGSASKIREYIAANSWIRCLVDLSEVPVFENYGSYVILLIFQKKFTEIAQRASPLATVVICKDFVGHALSDYLKGLRVQKNFYQIFDLDQETFQEKEWNLSSPQERRILSKLNTFEPLGNFLGVFQGIVTGNDAAFFVDQKDVPSSEKTVWKPLLTDREMLKYKVPKTVEKSVFYPILDGTKISINQLKSDFPISWKYLEKHKEKLQKGNPKNTTWWIPHRLRDPKELFRVKLITPHLVLLPKFGLDDSGRYVVSHAPFLTANDRISEMELLKFFLGILNSDVGAWLIASHSDKYSKGYARLEVGTLGKIPVPNPAKVSSADLKSIIDLVDKQIKSKLDLEVEKEINKVVARLYDVSANELNEIGLLSKHANDSIG